MWTASLGLAWFDTCADGWAVDTAKEEEQSAVQAAMIAGKSLGLVSMSALFGLLALRHGFGVIFLMIGGMALLVLAVVLAVRYEGKPARTHETVRDWRDLLKTDYVCFALFAAVYAVASFGTDGLLTLHLSETRSLGPLEIGYFGMWKGLGALTGAVAYALVRPRLGLKLAQWTGLTLLACGCVIPLMALEMPLAGAAWGICWGFQETAFVTLAMRFSQGRWAATLFAAAMIFSNVGNSVGEALGAPLVPQLGFEGVFLMFAGVALASAAFLPKIFSGETGNPTYRRGPEACG
jgi:predicted MFS family arabinose efflux permease